VIPIKSLHIKY